MNHKKMEGFLIESLPKEREIEMCIRDRNNSADNCLTIGNNIYRDWEEKGNEVYFIPFYYVVYLM